MTKRAYIPPMITALPLAEGRARFENAFAAALAGAHIGDPRCPATNGKGGECCCSELTPPKVRP
jgi:hypothetical protein